MVKGLGGVEPKVELHFTSDDVAVAASSYVHIGLQGVRLSRRRSQELNVDFVVVPRILLGV